MAWNKVNPGDLADIFHKGDNFYDFLYTFMNTFFLQKMGLLFKERICSLWGVDYLSEGETVLRITLESVSIPLDFSCSGEPILLKGSSTLLAHHSKTDPL